MSHVRNDQNALLAMGEFLNPFSVDVAVLCLLTKHAELESIEFVTASPKLCVATS